MAERLFHSGVDRYADAPRDRNRLLSIWGSASSVLAPGDTPTRRRRGYPASDGRFRPLSVIFGTR